MSISNTDSIKIKTQKEARSYTALYNYYTVWLDFEPALSNEKGHHKYHIYRDDQWIGVTTLGKFIDKEVKAKKTEKTTVAYKIQHVNEIGELLPLSEIDTIEVNFE